MVIGQRESDIHVQTIYLKIHDNDTRCTFLEDVTQGRTIWVDYGKLQLAKLGGIHSAKWNVSLPIFNPFVEGFI